MFTRMKYLCLALLALSALGCTSAGAASARLVHDFKADKSPVIITGEQVLPIEYKFGEGSTLTCLTSKVNGTFAMPTTQLTVEFTGSSCTMNGLAATLKPGKCRYVFNGETSEGHSNYFLECFSGEKGVVEVSGCKIEIGEQVIGNSIGYEKTEDPSGVKDVDVKFTTGAGVYTKSGILCGGIGGNGKDMVIFGTYTLKAYEDKESKEGAQVNFTYETTVLP
jgi:hypothetical protein